jgi:hypothetical protein
MKELSLRSHKCNYRITAPPASCRTWRPLLPPNNNAEDGDVPDRTHSDKILIAEVSYHITCSFTVNLNPYVYVRILNRP